MNNDDEISNFQPELNIKLNLQDCFAYSSNNADGNVLMDDDNHVFADVDDNDDDDDDYNSNAIHRIGIDVCNKSNNRHQQQQQQRRQHC
ncbi:hypothetical protein BLA29_014413, partial [Euroglyphus maynei]